MRKTVTRGTVQRVTRLQSSAMGNPRYAFTVSVPCGADGESQDLVFKTATNAGCAYKGEPPVGEGITLITTERKPLEVINYGWDRYPLTATEMSDVAQ